MVSFVLIHVQCAVFLKTGFHIHAFFYKNKEILAEARS